MKQFFVMAICPLPIYIVAFLDNADLESANFQYCRAYSTKLDRSNLVNANFKGANVRGSDFASAKLMGANMDCEGIETSHFTNALFDKYTRWPKGFNPLDHGCIKI